jgi:uncharacterized membrane protein
MDAPPATPPPAPPPQYQQPPPPPQYQQPPQFQQPYAAPQAAGLQDNVANALCYSLFWLTGILFLVLEPYSKNPVTRFHAWQSIFVFGAITVADIVLSIFSSMLLAMSYSLAPLISLLWGVFGLATLAIWAFLMYKAYNNERFVVPMVGPLAEKQK